MPIPAGANQSRHPGENGKLGLEARLPASQRKAPRRRTWAAAMRNQGNGMQNQGNGMQNHAGSQQSAAPPAFVRSPALSGCCPALARGGEGKGRWHGSVPRRLSLARLQARTELPRCSLNETESSADIQSKSISELMEQHKARLANSSLTKCAKIPSAPVHRAVFTSLLVPASSHMEIFLASHLKATSCPGSQQKRAPGGPSTSPRTPNPRQRAREGTREGSGEIRGVPAPSPALHGAARGRLGAAALPGSQSLGEGDLCRQRPPQLIVLQQAVG
ncbi:hypothetical protein Anapl_10376 [Anas platyrhynchos]|uniref:Uncharacterized protein n=1 Tax=Anas platyrhynchos TaxID=8839 RepID=R0KBF0_ANAPL|nr:hypothetical protein Anapl_10376 [Anas platyrhynchos]